MLERLRNLAVYWTARWREASVLQQRRMLLAGVSTTLAVIAGMYFILQPSWRILYSDLSFDDARQMCSMLTTAGIPYDMSGNGSILRVSAETLDKARLITATKASGKSGRSGFEIFDKPNWAGSDFEEKVNYQRALEGELEHTIETLDDVDSAHVHLVLPHEALFMEQQRDAKASVMLKLKKRRLGDDEAQAVRYFVASAVDGLKAENVVLLDGDGHSLAGTRNPTLDAKAAYEQSLSDHVIQTLEPIAGEGNVRATVTAEFEASSIDEVDEKYDPSAVVALSMERTEQSVGQPSAAAGIPGTATNTPSQPPLPLYPTKAAGFDNSKEESGTYGASKRTIHSIQGAGKLHRINVAVVVNDRQIPAASRKEVVRQQAWSSDELKEFTSLTQAAVGYDAARGDEVIVRNLQFEGIAVKKTGLLNGLIGTRVLVDPLLRYGTVLLIMIATYFLLLRPFLHTGLAAEASVMISDSAPGGSQKDRLAAGQPASKLLFEQVADHVQRDPVQSARILQSWIKAE